MRYHTPAQLDRLKQATLDILETVGVKFPSQRALDILAAHGCRVDAARQVVTFPPDVVLAAMARAPRYFGLGARDPACAFSLSDDTTWCTSDGCGVEIVDFETGVKRPSTKADLARVTRLLDYLSSMAFWWPTVSAGDCGADRPAPRDRRRLEQHRQAPAGLRPGRARGALRRRDGDGRRRQRRGAAPGSRCSPT